MRLISWNIQWGRGADGRVDLDRIVSHARQFADFDVLCLQEVSAGYPELPGSDGSDQFAALAARLPGFTRLDGIAVDAPHPSGQRRRFGNAIFSRLPVASAFRHLLPWPVDAAVPSMQRMALEATLLAPGGVLRVTTTHLEYYSALQRAAQVERLRELHAEASQQARTPRPGTPSLGPFDHTPRGGPAILVGDFNMKSDAAERIRLQSPVDAGTPRYLDAWERLNPGLEQPPTVGVHDKAQWPGPPFAFDFAFVSEDLVPRLREMRVDAQSDASDHQPVLLDIDTETAPAPPQC
jgi:endonuclease/exonuclease/phosphatase family metal-dependent hydrolase